MELRLCTGVGQRKLILCAGRQRLIKIMEQNTNFMDSRLMSSSFSQHSGRQSKPKTPGVSSCGCPNHRP